MPVTFKADSFVQVRVIGGLFDKLSHAGCVQNAVLLVLFCLEIRTLTHRSDDSKLSWLFVKKCQPVLGKPETICYLLVTVTWAKWAGHIVT